MDNLKKYIELLVLTRAKVVWCENCQLGYLYSPGPSLEAYALNGPMNGLGIKGKLDFKLFFY